MKKIMKRLCSKAGESLVESMAAILIFTMGSIIMLSMVSTAADINTTAQKEDDSYNKQIVAAEMTDLEYQSIGNVKITINNTDSDEIEVEIFRYKPKQGEEAIENPLHTFYKREVEGS